MSHSLLRALQSDAASERAEACRACVDDASAVLLLDALADALGDPEKAVARAASDALVALSEGHAEVHEVLRGALRSEQAHKRFASAFASARISPPRPGLLPVLVEAMGSKDGDVRWTAARIAVDMARLHDEAFRALLALAESADEPALRRMAIFCLRDLAPDDPSAARVLIAATREPDLHLRRAAMTAIGSLTEAPPEVRARLIEALHGDPDAASRRIAALSLAGISARRDASASADTIAELERARSESDDVDLGRAVGLALARIGRA